MCLLVVLHRVHPEAPLVVAANRDELLTRPATAMTVLEEAGPRILGGRDEVAGGTWLAVGEQGLVAALTNRPGGERDPSKRSRGEWPVFLARHPTPSEAAESFVERFDPGDFNPGWILVGSPEELVYIDMTTADRGRVAALPPGVHLLENRPLEGPSAKAELVRERLVGVEKHGGDALARFLGGVLASHESPSRGRREAAVGQSSRPLEAEAACVHLGAYGTRSSTLVMAAAARVPRVWSAAGPPCTHPFRRVSWATGDASGRHLSR